MMRICWAVLALVLAVQPAYADDDEVLDHLSWEADLGFRAPGMMQVGQWKPIDLGFEGLGGVRLGRFELLGELNYDALWPASWTHGSIAVAGNDDVSGSMLRVALVGRYTFGRFIGNWGKRVEQRWVNGFFVDAAIGDEVVSVDRMESFSRRDYTIGIGFSNGVQLGPHGGVFAAYYSLDMTWAPAASTPQADCGGGCSIYPGTGARDVGWVFNFGVLFGG